MRRRVRMKNCAFTSLRILTRTQDAVLTLLFSSFTSYQADSEKLKAIMFFFVLLSSWLFLRYTISGNFGLLHKNEA